MEITLARGRVVGPVALLIAAALFVLGAAYAVGLINTLGYEKKTVTFAGFGTATKSGGGLGLKHMVFFEGQTFFADYDAVVREGSLRIGILDAFGPIGDKPHFVKAIELSGRGDVTYRIPKTGVYSIYFEGSPSGRGYDLSYTVRWGAR